jgi:hypothetical protein
VLRPPLHHDVAKLAQQLGAAEGRAAEAAVAPVVVARRAEQALLMGHMLVDVGKDCEGLERTA